MSSHPKKKAANSSDHEGGSGNDSGASPTEAASAKDKSKKGSSNSDSYSDDDKAASTAAAAAPSAESALSKTASSSLSDHGQANMKPKQDDVDDSADLLANLTLAAAPASQAPAASQSPTDQAAANQASPRRAPPSKGHRSTVDRIDDRGSEGDSDSDDQDVVWRGLTPADWANIQAGRGLPASTNKTGAALYHEVHHHVSLGSQQGHAATCKLLSATRSKKVAARYAGDKLKDNPDPIGLMAKIRLTDVPSVDLTLPAEMARSKLRGADEKWAVNSQEVVIYGNVPQANIIGLFQVTAYAPWKQPTRQSTIHADFVRFRAYETSKYPYKCYGIDPYKQ